MIPKLLNDNPSPRQLYMAGTWNYARGKDAIEHPDYVKACDMAQNPSAYGLINEPWDRGWIRTWQDVAATLKGCWFDEERSARPVKLTKLLRHYKGKWAGQRFEFADFWEWDIVRPLFGWMKKLEYGEKPVRRYKRGSAWMSKKNGKTTSFSALLTYLLGFDDEGGAEVYSAAVDKVQSARVYRDCELMMKKAHEGLRKDFKFTNSTYTVAHPESDSIYRPLSSDANNSEGLDIHALLYDELHAVKSDKLWSVLRYGDIARSQPLFMAFSTSGEYDSEAVGWLEFEYAVKIRDGIIEDDEYFAYVAAADPEKDDWESLETWIKANPAWGITQNEAGMRKKYETAKNKPSEINDFKRYLLGIWTHGASKFINMDAWANRCRSDIGDLAGRRCWAGLDLSAVVDLTATAFLFEPDENGVMPLIVRGFMPESRIIEAQNRDQVPYAQWIEDGWVFETPGERVDYEFVEKYVKDMAGRHSFVDLGFDRWNAESIRKHLDDDTGIECYEVSMGYSHMSQPTKELEALILEGKIAHENNPMLKWMMSNLIVDKDANSNVKPNKGKSTQKIDGAVAGIIALARYLVWRDQEIKFDGGILSF